MAAPLPSGLPINVVPQAPRVDPNIFAPDVLKQFQVMQAGLHLGEELKNLDNKRALRELEAAQIDAAKAKNKLDMLQIEHAQTNLPQIVQTQLAQAQAAQAAAELARIRDQAAVSVGEPVISAELAGQKASNALAGARAAGAYQTPELNAAAEAQTASNALASASADAALARQPATERTQALEAAKTQGSWGVPSGNALEAGGVPLPFRKSVQVEEVDPETGNTVERIDIIDSRNGATISKGEPRLKKLGADEKSVAASVKDATALVQTKTLAKNLDAALDEYIKKGEGGLTQAIATNAANSAPTGVISVVKKALGAKAQSEATVRITGEIQNLKNTIANSLFGSALSKEESTNLQGMLPVAEDLADPKRAKEKLQGTMRFIEAKLKPYEDRGILRKAGFDNQEAPAAGAAKTPMQILQSGGTVLYKGVPHKLGVGPDGRPGLVPVR